MASDSIDSFTADVAWRMSALIHRELRVSRLPARLYRKQDNHLPWCQCVEDNVVNLYCAACTCCRYRDLKFTSTDGRRWFILHPIERSSVDVETTLECKAVDPDPTLIRDPFLISSQKLS